MNRTLPTPSEVFRSLPCYCGRLQLASRVISRIYNDELRQADIEATQFMILRLIADLGPMTQNQLAERTAAGKTTISRNLKLLQRRRWLTSEEGEDRRCRLVSLTAAGRRKLDAAQPYWEQAQERIRASMSPAQLEAFFGMLPAVTEAALTA